ncbi:MAG TPA: potassium transporter TrkA [Persephonella sp.]|uniref:TrkA domain protein n=1 Tax=Persephonella marina (strain DSM 14350 / EX-H1) TaxID=123214 RepID=C0QQD3_PERMH|nr:MULTISPECIES: cation:proton antiporter regulatory subunit [Persephonella]ACO04429.1 TrkA domain protein [Persephonella marina EX-H1]HCB69515.1 potassium transporter TrkA [Persephonella sp.]
MEFKESDLPGIGKKFSIITSEKFKISVVVHVTGKREMFVFEPDDYDEPVCDVVLTEEEANQLGSVLMGAYYRPEQEKEKKLLIENLAIEWIKVPSNSPIAGKKIGESQIRQRTGVTVIAIMKEKEGETIVNPLPDNLIEGGDTIVIIGTRDQIERFLREFNIDGR